MRMLTGLALAQLTGGGLRDWVAPDVLGTVGLPSLEAALRYVHRPPPDADIDRVERGPAPGAAASRVRGTARPPDQPAPAAPGGGSRSTRGRCRRARTSSNDASAQPGRSSSPVRSAGSGRKSRGTSRSEHPMMRLVQGDVGSGKTVVAALAALRAVEHGAQAAVMAPTELLAEQHARNFLGWLEPLGVRVGLLTGRLTGRARAALLQDLSSGARAGRRRHARAVPGGRRFRRASRSSSSTSSIASACTSGCSCARKGWRTVAIRTSSS